MYRATIMLTGEARDACMKRRRIERNRRRIRKLVKMARFVATEVIAAVGMAVLFVLTIPFLLCV